jgi:hypothetical protein
MSPHITRWVAILALIGLAGCVKTSSLRGKGSVGVASCREGMVRVSGQAEQDLRNRGYRVTRSNPDSGYARACGAGMPAAIPAGPLLRGISPGISYKIDYAVTDSRHAESYVTSFLSLGY